MAVTGAITTGFRDENGVDLGRQLVEKDYLISVYPNLLSNMKAPAAFAWGAGTSGEFGNNAVSFASSPTQVLIGSSLWKQVSGGYNHAAAIAIDGTLWAWGLGTSGQLGNGVAGHRSSPIQTISFGTNWSVVGNSGNHVSSTKTDGTLWTWGLGTSGQLGDLTLVTKSSPVQAIVYAENWGSVCGGRYGTTAIKTDGTLWVWGNNGNGQLGDNTIIHRSSPVQVIGISTNWSTVAYSIKNYHVAAIKTDGTLWIWGLNSYGGLGDNTTTSKSSPIQTVAFGSNWSKVACGSNYSVAIKTDGTLWTWGRNSFGQLGDNTIIHRSSPVQTVAFGTNWSSVSCGYYHAAAIKTDGTLWMWGQGTNSQIGDNALTNRSSPVQTIAFGTNWSSVACGSNYSVAIKTDGTLWTWGNNLSGQLGDNTTTGKSSPIQTITFGTNWSSVSCGNAGTAAIKTDGTLWTWGYNLNGELGDNTNVRKSSPVQTIGRGTTWSSISCGYSNTYSIKKDGTLWSWGSEVYGAVGDNDAITNKSSPVQPLAYGLSTSWSTTSTGNTHTSAIKKDGTLWTWGLGTSGQLGNNTATSTSAPVQEMTFSANWSSLSAGGSFAGAIKTDSTLWLWGLGTSGQLGDNTATSKSSPVQTVSVGGPLWSSVAGNGYNTAAIKTDGTLWTWGGNYYGPLGDGTRIHRSSPVQTIAFGSNWSKVACGGNHIAAIKTDGTLWSWGRNSYGVLGDNTFTHRSSPVQTVAGGSNWSKVACGVENTAAIKTDGTLWTWGRNFDGNLGDNTITNKSSPVQTITGGTNWSSVACGITHTAAIKTDGTLWTWGNNYFGNLGDNTITHRSSPVQTIAGGTNWSSVACGGYYTVAIKSDGTIWTWGRNNNGQLGNNTTTHRSSPVQVIGFANTWSSVACGYRFTAATKTDGTLWCWGNGTGGNLGEGVLGSRSSPVQTVTGGTNWSSVACGYWNTAAIKTDGTLWGWGRNEFGQLGDNTITHRSSPVQTIGALAGLWQSISCGTSHVASVKTDGTLWLWGSNSYGRLGDNTVTSKSSPIQTITFGTTWSKVSAGYDYTGAIKTDGTAWTWGRNNNAQLGDATIIHRSSPVQVTVYAENWSYPARGLSSNNSACVKSDGTLWVWGENASGALGDNTITAKSSPIQTITFGSTWSTVECGYRRTAAVKTDGTLWMWGFNGRGELGDSTIIHRSSPIQTIAFGTTWSSVSTSLWTTAALKTDGTLWTWGYNQFGQLGDNTITNKSSPVQTITGGTTWSKVSVGRNHVGAIKTDGTLWSWGANSSGQLGDNTSVSNRSSPVQTIAGGITWSFISCGNYHTMATKTDGTLWAWGQNYRGCLGDNTITNKSSPIQTIAYGTNWSTIAAGFHSIATKTDGTLWVWGTNTFSQLGDITLTHRSSPIQTFAFGNTWSKVGGTNNFSFATKTDGTLWVWGINSSTIGQLGDGTTGTNRSFPVQPLAYSFATNWSNISCGAINTVATKTNGTLWIWGAGTNGVLGNNLTTTTISLPIQTLAYGTNWSQTNFSAPSKNSGSSTTAAIKTDGTLWVWGNNASGQLANTLLPITRSSPNQTLDYSNQWQQVTGGSTHTMAIKQDGTLWGFGLNSEGEIGINNNSFMASPIQEVTGSSWKQVAAGFRFSAAIKANNTLWIWGRNSYGNLGDNTTVSKSSPIQEVTGGSWNQIACGSYHMGGIKKDGTLWMWGLNTSGQLGDSTVLHRSSPIQTVAGGTNWKQVACGSGAVASSGHTAAIKTDGTLWVWGNGNNGRLGDNTATSKSSPIQTIAGGTNWRQVVCTASTTLATKTDGSLWSWGIFGVIGDNTAVSKSSPVQTAIGDKSWKNITIGNMGLATYAIRDWSY